MNNLRIQGIEWVVFGMLFAGIILIWTHLDEHGILLNIGLLSVGLAAVIEGVKRKSHKSSTVATLHIIVSLIIISLASGNLFSGNSDFTILVIAIVFQYLLREDRGLSFKKS